MDVEQRALIQNLESNALAYELLGETTLPRLLRSAAAALTPPEGHVVVTRNGAGQAVAVTRQDDEGRILSVIAEFGPTAGWAAAVDRELVAAELGVAKIDDSTDVAAAKLRELIDWHVSVATDPAVNGGYVLVPVEAKKNAARYEWLRDNQSCSISIEHNYHHLSYEKAEEALDEPQGYYAECPEEEQKLMIEADSIWTIHEYPNTPVGFNTWHGASLDTAIDAAMVAARPGVKP